MDTFLQVAGWGLVALSFAGLVVAVRVLREELPIRVGYDILRMVVALACAFAITVVLAVETPAPLTLAAVVVGAIAGVVQGRAFKVRFDGATAVASRTVIGVALWGGGVLAAQTAGLLGRAGAANVGLAVSYFSAAGIAGVIVGRSSAVARARRPLVGAAVVAVAVVAAIAALPRTPGYARGTAPTTTTTTPTTTTRVVMNGRATSATFSKPSGRSRSTTTLTDGTLAAQFDFVNRAVSGFTGEYRMRFTDTVPESPPQAFTNFARLGAPKVTDNGDTFRLEGGGTGSSASQESSTPMTVTWSLDWTPKTGAFTGTVIEAGVPFAATVRFSGSATPVTDPTTTTSSSTTTTTTTTVTGATGGREDDASPVDEEPTSDEAEDETVDALAEAIGSAAADEADDIPIEDAAGASLAGLVGVAAILGISLLEGGISGAEARARRAPTTVARELPVDPPPPPDAGGTGGGADARSTFAAAERPVPEGPVPERPVPEGPVPTDVAPGPAAADGSAVDALRGQVGAEVGEMAVHEPQEVISLGETDPILANEPIPGVDRTDQLAGDFVEDSAELVSDIVDDKSHALGSAALPSPDQGTDQGRAVGADEEEETRDDER